jgi:5-methylcytosine-specific restriction endonuclease McrA
MSVSLRSLSDSDILSRVQDLTTRERKLTLALLLHLNEIERRKLHLKQGYSSMFDYCTSGLGYSEPSAMRRIATARCVARFPEIYRLLETNELNVSAVARVSRVLTAANSDVLLARIRGKSYREIEAIVAEYQPGARPRDVVRPVVVRVPEALAPLAASQLSPRCGSASTTAPVAADADSSTVDANGACEKAAYLRREGDFDPMADPNRKQEKRLRYQFTASEAFQKKVEKIKTLAWHRLPANPSLEQVFEIALDCYIAKHDPSRRRERRERRLERAASATKASEAKRAASRPNRAARHIAEPARDEVFTRDGGRRRYVSAEGRRCASVAALQIDHIKPFARGGASTIDNLRLLCAYHNRLESERLMGRCVPPRLRE